MIPFIIAAAVGAGALALGSAAVVVLRLIDVTAADVLDVLFEKIGDEKFEQWLSDNDLTEGEAETAIGKYRYYVRGRFFDWNDYAGISRAVARDMGLPQESIEALFLLMLKYVKWEDGAEYEYYRGDDTLLQNEKMPGFKSSDPKDPGAIETFATVAKWGVGIYAASLLIPIVKSILPKR